MRRLTAAILLLLATAPADAWEGATTHAGIAEQAAATANLHRLLRERFAIRRGLYAPLSVGAKDKLAKELRRTIPPTHGYAPDLSGRQTALGWLVAGAATADMNGRAVHHFYDPRTKRGLSRGTLSGAEKRLRRSMLGLVSGGAAPTEGQSALRWLWNKNNPQSIPTFRKHVANAAMSPSRAERERQLAYALWAAGGVLHVLADLGSPSHVRNDLAAHYDRLGNESSDLGSRFETVARLSRGRLGIDPVADPIERPSLRAYFASKDKQGLADITSRRWFSAYTLPNRVPASEDLRSALRNALVRPLPREMAIQPAKKRLVDPTGTCLANYYNDGRWIAFQLGDACVLEQQARILPTVVAYSAGLLRDLFGPAPSITFGDTIVATAAVSQGEFFIYWDDEHGARKKLASQRVSDGRAEAPLPPAGATHITVVWRDAAGRSVTLSRAFSGPPGDKVERPAPPIIEAPKSPDDGR